MKLFRRLDIIIIFWLYILQHVHSTCLSSLDEDMVFVLDASWSIWRSQWPGILEFVSSLVTQSLPQGTRVGAVVYGTEVRTAFGLEQYSTFDEIGAAIKGIKKPGGITHTKAALQQAYDVFTAAWDVRRAREIVLITDGEPDDNPCEIAPTLKSAGIKVVTLVVGTWYEKTNMDCLVNNVDKDVIPFGSFTEMEASLGTVEEVLCSIDYDINVIEVQAYSDSPRFIEIYNMGASVDVYGLQFSGMYTGPISSSTLVSQGDILLISDDVSLANDCTSNCVFYHWTGSTQSYEDPADDGTINEGFSISISASDSDVQSVTWTDNAGFPNIVNGRSFELLLPMSNNNLGSNWRSSCDTGGSPGKLPGGECPGCKSDSECKAQGDQGATCNTNFRSCICSTRGYYIQGSTCEPLPAPSNCVAHPLPGYDNRYKFDWTQPDFVDTLAFMRIEIRFTLSGSYNENMLEILGAPPTSVFAIEENHKDDVRITAVFNKTDVSYWTEDLYCVVQRVPTPSPSRAPTKTPTDAPTKSPIVSPVPNVESCELRIAESTKTEAGISWVWNGQYKVHGVNTDPTAFILKWGESATNYFLYVESSSRDAEISLVASWNYSQVIATVTVQGFEDRGAVLSESVGCSVMQATPSPVTYFVPPPEACTLDINVGGETGIVTITPPSDDYIVKDDIVQLGYRVWVGAKSYTEHNLGYEGKREQFIVIPTSTYNVYAVSLGTEADKHPESGWRKCDVVSPQPTFFPTVEGTKYEVPTLSSCEVLLERRESLDNLFVIISWVKGSQYTHDGVSTELWGYKYRLGGMSEWIKVQGDATTSDQVYWSASYAAMELDTYMVAVGEEKNNKDVIRYPESSAIICDLVTKDPTPLPTSAPSRYPTKYPSSIPTGSPTFELPEIGFVVTNAITGSIMYNCMEGDAAIEIQIWQQPVSLNPMEVFWEIVDSNGLPVVDTFNETNGTVSFKEWRTNYPSAGPSCSWPACIPEYECVSHAGSDYCVKDVGKVWEKIFISANDDEISNEDPEYFHVVLRRAQFSSSDVFYESTSQIRINSQSNNATVKLFDAASQAFCLASPDSLACLGGQQFALEWWHWMIIIVLILLLIMAVVFYRYQSTVAKRALRDKQIAEEAWDNEVLIGEEGFGPGMTAHSNPLALSMTSQRKMTYRATATMPEGDEEEGEDDEGNYRVDMTKAFEIEKSQFVPTESKKKEHRTLQPVLHANDNLEEVLNIEVIRA